jgi:hypothetical protein
VLAKSPQTLLFEKLPAACGLDKLGTDEPDANTLAEFSGRLKDALRELKQAYPNLLDSMRGLLVQAFSLDRHTPLEELRAILRGRLEGLDSYTVDVDGLRAFIRRVVKPNGKDEEWFTNILMFLGQKPPRKWSDTDLDAAEFRLSEFSRRLNDLEKLRVHFEGVQHRRGTDFDVLLLRTVRKGASERDEIVCIDKGTRAAYKTVKAKLAKNLTDLGDRELRLAVLAELVDEFMGDQDLESEGKETHKEDKSDGQLKLVLGDGHG